MSLNLWLDIAFMTPIQVHAGQERAIRLAGSGVRQGVTAGNRLVDPEDNFANWAAYVTSIPPVLLIRATPRLAEGFLTTLARGAALTQGVAIPAIKRPKSGFDRMTLSCGSTTLVPVHALTKGLTARAIMSVGPPGGNGTITRIGLDG